MSPIAYYCIFVYLITSIAYELRTPNSVLIQMCVSLTECTEYNLDSLNYLKSWAVSVRCLKMVIADLMFPLLVTYFKWLHSASNILFFLNKKIQADKNIAVVVFLNFKSPSSRCNISSIEYLQFWPLNSAYASWSVSPGSSCTKA